MNLHLRRCFILILVSLAAVSGRAQDSDDSSADDVDGGRVASLSLAFDRRGSLDVSLDLPESAASSVALQAALAATLHCPAGALDHPRPFDNSRSRYQENWTAAQRERYQKQIAKFNERRWTGKCDGVLARQDGLLAADFDYASLAAELQRNGVDRLSVYVAVPRTKYRDYTRTYLVREPLEAANALAYEIPLGPNSKPGVLHLAYGFRRADLYRGLGILAAFLLLPVCLTLWMRRGALAAGEEDAIAAWFGYFRSLNWMVGVAMLLWITSGLGARQVLQDWVANQGLSTWSAAVSGVLVIVAPAFLIYLVCIGLSYPVYARLRRGHLTRREFLAQQLVTVGVQAVPLTLGLASLQILHEQLELAVALLILTFILMQVLLTLKLRLMKNYPQALTTGELRDRVFALAGRLGVKVNQVFVLAAGKGQVANAYAAKNKVVMFTDYLLEHLSKREVDAIAAHELAHLQHSHPRKRGAAFMAAIFLPFYFTWISSFVSGLLMITLGFLPASAVKTKLVFGLWSGMNAFNQWSLRDFALVMLGLTGFYFLSRRFENIADATAVRLTGDPAAQITGLLKVHRLNRVPIQWGKTTGSWLTHPSTVRRAQRIAAAGGMEPEQLQQILQQYAAEGSTAGVAPPDDCYALPAMGDPEKARTAMRSRIERQAKLWVQLAMYVIPPALFSLLIQRTHVEANFWLAIAAYLAGIAITAGIVSLTSRWLGEAGRGREKARVMRRFEREHVPAGQAGDIVVGFAPGPYPRLYGARYHWDSGFLVLAKGRLQFIGEQIKFSLLPSEIDGIVVGRGGPSWWKLERLYLRWKSADGSRSGVFNLNPLEPGSTWQNGARVRTLAELLQLWQARAESYPAVRPEFAELHCPELGEVTCISPRKIGKRTVNAKILLYLFPLAVGVGVLMHAGIFYLCSTAFAVRMFQSVPYWRYRDQLPPFPPAASPDLSYQRAAGASAGDLR